MNVSRLPWKIFPVNLHDLKCYILCFLLEFQKNDSQRLLESFSTDEKEHGLVESKAEPYTSKEEMVLEVKLCSCRWMSILLHVAVRCSEPAPHCLNFSGFGERLYKVFRRSVRWRVGGDCCLWMQPFRALIPLRNSMSPGALLGYFNQHPEFFFDESALLSSLCPP